jgi:hypothetical protein
MNTSLPDIYNNLNNYSVTKRPFTSTPPSQSKTKNILLFYFKNLNSKCFTPIKQLNTVVKILGPTLKHLFWRSNYLS